MNGLETIGDWVVEHAVEIAKGLWQMVQYAPLEYQAQLRLVGIVLSYLLVIVVAGLVGYKLYRVSLAALERVRTSVMGLANLTGELLHRSFHTLFQDAIPAMFKAKTYICFLEWCSMTDREAIEQFAASTRPRLVQQLLGFMVILASFYAAIAFACAISFVLIKENGSPPVYHWIGVVVMSGVFACFIGAFDRSIAGSPRLFRLPAMGAHADRQNLPWSKRVSWLLMDVATPENLRGCAMVLMRLVVCWMSASFIANVLAVLLFQTSIERRMDIQMRAEIDKSLPAKMVDVGDEKLPVVVSPECQGLFDSLSNLEKLITNEADIRFKSGAQKGSFIGSHYKALIAQRDGLFSRLKESCHVEKEGDDVAFQKAKNDGERLAQARKRDEERVDALKHYKVLDLGAGMEHVKNVPGYTMLYWLLFSLEMLVLATKLILNSSYDHALEVLERERLQLAPSKSVLS
jgi:hypothetical protein